MHLKYYKQDHNLLLIGSLLQMKLHEVLQNSRFRERNLIVSSAMATCSLLTPSLRPAFGSYRRVPSSTTSRRGTLTVHAFGRKTNDQIS